MLAPFHLVGSPHIGGCVNCQKQLLNYANPILHKPVKLPFHIYPIESFRDCRQYFHVYSRQTVVLRSLCGLETCGFKVQNFSQESQSILRQCIQITLWEDAVESL